MLVATMNDDELLREVIYDLDKVVHTTFQRLKQEYTHERHKQKISSTNPYVREYCIRSARKNYWLIFLSKSPAVEKFENVQHCAGTLVTYYESKKGLRVIKLLLNGYLAVFNGHFFTRYNERMKLGLSKPLEIIKAFFRANMHADYKLYPQNNRVCSVGISQDGFLLGEFDEGILVNKTFISRDLLRKEQGCFEETFIGDLQLEWLKNIAKRTNHNYGFYKGTDLIFMDDDHAAYLNKAS